MSAPGRPGKLRVGLGRSRSTRVDELGVLEEAVDALEVAMAENRDLEVPLATLVDRLEGDVAEVLTRRAGTGMGA